MGSPTITQWERLNRLTEAVVDWTFQRILRQAYAFPLTSDGWLVSVLWQTQIDVVGPIEQLAELAEKLRK